MERLTDPGYVPENETLNFMEEEFSENYQELAELYADFFMYIEKDAEKYQYFEQEN